MIILVVLAIAAVEIVSLSWGVMVALGIFAHAIGVPVLAIGLKPVAAAVSVYIVGKIPTYIIKASLED